MGKFLSHVIFLVSLDFESTCWLYSDVFVTNQLRRLPEFGWFTNWRSGRDGPWTQSRHALDLIAQLLQSRLRVYLASKLRPRLLRKLVFAHASWGIEMHFKAALTSFGLPHGVIEIQFGSAWRFIVASSESHFRVFKNGLGCTTLKLRCIIFFHSLWKSIV